MRRLVACLMLAAAACKPAEAPQVASAPDALPAATSDAAPPPAAPEAPLFSVVDGQPSFPAPFMGRWDASLEACAEEYSDMRLVIDATNMRFWESEGSPTKVEPAGVNAIVVDSDFSGEGDTWTARYRFALADGGETLMVDRVKRVRCEVEK